MSFFPLVSTWKPASAGAVPTVSAISPVIGFYDGGDTVTITVNSSTGCTGAAIGGVALTSFAIVDATHVSGMTGAKARSTGNTVTVTNASGTSAPAAAFEYFDPTSLPGGGTAVTYYTARHCTQSLGIITAMPDSKSTNTATVHGSPVYTASDAAYNNLPTIGFSGATQYLTSANAGGITTGARSVMMVGQGSTGAGNAFWVSQSNAACDEFFWSGGGGEILFSSDNSAVLAGTSGVGASASVQVAVFNGASSAAYQSAHTASTGNAGTLQNLTGVTWCFGNQGSAPAAGSSMSGKFFEAAIYASALSNSDAQYLEVGYGKICNITIGP